MRADGRRYDDPYAEPEVDPGPRRRWLTESELEALADPDYDPWGNRWPARKPRQRPGRYDWALEPIDRSLLSPRGRQGLSFARSLAGGMAGTTRAIARQDGYYSERTVRRLIARARREQRRGRQTCAHAGCDTALPAEATRRRRFCSGRCRVAALRERQRVAAGQGG